GTGAGPVPEPRRRGLDCPRTCARRSDDADARSGVASGRLAVGSALMLPHLFAAERLSPSAREHVLHNFSVLLNPSAAIGTSASRTMDHARRTCHFSNPRRFT